MRYKKKAFGVNKGAWEPAVVTVLLRSRRADSSLTSAEKAREVAGSTSLFPAGGVKVPGFRGLGRMRTGVRRAGCQGGWSNVTE